MKLIKVSGTTLLLLTVIFIKNLKAQELRPGNQYPVYELANVINYTSPVLRLSDFKGKVIILDFWNTYCSSCIQAFPKLDSLQKLFKEEVQIILVNNESSEKIETFFKKHPTITKPGVPMIISDTKLQKSFPAEGRPYIVWIDQQGVVRNFSNGTNLSKQNLRYFIDGKKLLFRDPTLECFGSAIEENNFECISFISHCFETLNIGNNEIQETNNGKSVSLTNNCASIVELFIKAFSEFGKYNFKTRYGLRLYVADSFKYQYPENLELMDNWLNENAYNYQLVLPKSKTEQAYKIMQQDLIRYFDMNVFVKKIPVQGVVLLKDSVNAQSHTKGRYTKNKNSFEHARFNPDSVYIFKDQPFEKFSRWLKEKLSHSFPFIDSTNYSGRISIVVRKSSLRPFNLQQFREDLSTAGLNCVHKEIEADVLCIEENGKIKADKKN